MINKQELTQVITHVLDGAGGDLFLVDVKVSADNVIDVAIDSMGEGVTIDDCVMVNDAVLAAFDRDQEDYELTVGSYSISDPFVVRQHYDKNVGGEVEVLTTAGIKSRGVLKGATDNDFTIVVSKKMKIEGKKRPEPVEVEETYRYDEIKYTKNIIQFK